MKKLFWIVCGVAALGWMLGDNSKTKSGPGGSVSAVRAQATAVSFTSLMPPSQTSFVQAVRQGQAAYQAGANEMAKGAARPARARDICSAFQSGRADRWVGTVYGLSSNNDGKGVLTIHLGDDIYVKTWNNSLSDTGSNTLIEPSSQLFASANSLSKGQPVVFSGSLFRDKTDCFRESSMTLSGSLQEPEFIMKFTDIAPIQ